MSLPLGCVEECRGCKHRHLTARASESQKDHFVRTRLSKWSDAHAPLIAPSPELRWKYRERGLLHVGWSSEGVCEIGMIRQRKPKLEVIDLKACPLHSDRVNERLAWIRGQATRAKHLEFVAVSFAAQQWTLVFKSKPTVALQNWVNQEVTPGLIEKGVEGVWIHWNPSFGKRTLSSKGWQLVAGTMRSKTNDGYVYGPCSFQQVARELNQDARLKTEDFFSLSKESLMVDAYSGIGVSIAQWTRNGAKVLGLELSGEAIECAGINSPVARVLRGRCVDRIPQIEEWLDENGVSEKQWSLYCNPPRTGLEQGFAKWIAEKGRPKKIAYLSCSPGTLSRDLDVLCEKGRYRVEKIQSYDFFPQTHHVEVLVLLSREGRNSSLV